LQSVQIEENDWRVVFGKFDTERTLFYADPPYNPDTRIDGRYRYELSDDDHNELVQVLLGLKGMVVLSGYMHKAFGPLERCGWMRKDFDVPAYTSDRRTRRIESIWVSPNALPRNNGVYELNRMRAGAHMTHRARVASTETKLRTVIQKIRATGGKVTITAVARAAKMTRQQVGQRYSHLFET
jgi:DNA adenine methylase